VTISPVAPITTLPAFLSWRADYQGDHPAFAFMDQNLQIVDTEGYASLRNAASNVASNLEQLGVENGPVILACAPGLDFVRAFAGILCSGRIAVPTQPPADEQSIRRLKYIAGDSQAKWVVASRQAIEQLKQDNGKLLSDLSWIAVEDAIANNFTKIFSAPLREDIAIYQYSSGTVGLPHGVKISHENLMENSELIRRTFVHTAKHRGLVWLPPYHDMGLIGGIVQPIYAGFRTTLMAPRTFLRNPLNWLRAISLTGATTSGGPNFAYEACLGISNDELERANLELTRWSVAFNGAEPINPATLTAFAKRFQRFGFRSSSFCCCYGLAEATLLVSGESGLKPPTILSVDRDALALGEVQITTEPGPSSRMLVGHGSPMQIVRIVKSDGGEAPAMSVGEIWVAGSSVTQPIVENDDRFGAQLPGEKHNFVRTGDLGFLHKGEVYVSGRSKAILVVRGKNHQAEDIEATVRNLRPAFAQLSGAAFGDDERGVIIVQEVPRQFGDTTVILREIREAISESHGIAPMSIALVRHRSLARTPSGKIRRHAVAQDFIHQRLNVVDEWHAPERMAVVARKEPLPVCPPFDGLGVLDKTALLKTWLMSIMAVELKIPVDELHPDTHFGVYGLDSMSAVSLTIHIGDQLQCELEETVFWDYPNFTMLSDFLARPMQGSALGEMAHH
jgi:acyl-CoA synthetase (AMP-forming)/AMP-acid ligase II/acyl carrier protein